MKGSVVLNIEEEKTEKKEPIIREGRITESFEIQMEEMAQEVEKKLEEIAKRRCQDCDEEQDNVCIMKCLVVTIITFGVFGILLYIRNNN
jgi:hypothetical protein